MLDPGVDRAQRHIRHIGLLCVVCLLAACAPTLNWREVHMAGSGAAAWFPCKPDRFTRKVQLAAVEVEMVLESCAADGVTYAIGHAEFANPAQSVAALQQLRAAAASHVGGTTQSLGPFRTPGMTPSPLAERLQFVGRRAGGGRLTEQAAFFVKGLRVFQASVVGDALEMDAVDTFLAGIRLPG